MVRLTRNQLIHIVSFGDTLRSISMQYYGNDYCWARIWTANQQTLKNPENVMAGMSLVIP